MSKFDLEKLKEDLDRIYSEESLEFRTIMALSILIEQLRDIVNGQNTYNDNLEYIDHIKAITKELTDIVGLTNIHESE